MLREGSIVDATTISAPNSTKNRSGKRDRDVGPQEMHQTKKATNGTSAAASVFKNGLSINTERRFPGSSPGVPMPGKGWMRTN